jgi:hypothetical protein
MVWLGIGPRRREDKPRNSLGQVRKGAAHIPDVRPSTWFWNARSDYVGDVLMLTRETGLTGYRPEEAYPHSRPDGSWGAFCIESGSPGGRRSAWPIAGRRMPDPRPSMDGSSAMPCGAPLSTQQGVPSRVSLPHWNRRSLERAISLWPKASRSSDAHDTAGPSVAGGGRTTPWPGSSQSAPERLCF